MLRTAHRLIGILAFLVLGSAAQALDYPNRTVRIIVPYAPGGSAEMQARVLGEELSKIWKQPVIIENKPGAGTTVGAAHVASSEPDGYTLYLAGPSHVISHNLYNVRYDPITSFAPISRVATSPLIVFVHPKLGINSLKELVELAKKRPGELNYATSGVGASPHFAAELLQSTTDIKIRHVPHRGSAPAITALLGQHVEIAIGDMSAYSLAKEGTLTALAVTSVNRTPSLPNVPTVTETVAKEFDVTNWSAILAPAATPEPIVSIINKSIAKAMQVPEVRQRYEAQGFEATPSTPEALKERMIKEEKRYTEIVKRLGLSKN